jgi:type I restriction enzyme S subunit
MKTDACIHDGWLLLANVEKHFDEDYLFNLLNSDDVQRQFESLAAGSGVRNLNIEVVKKVVVKIPPKDTQTKLCVPLNSLDLYINEMNTLLRVTKNLRSALLSDLLSGNHEIPTTYDKLIGAA